MVELVDTLVSGTSAFKSMEVRVFFWAEKYDKKHKNVAAFVFLFYIVAGLELPEAAPSEYEDKAPWMAPSAAGGGPEPRNRMLRGGGFESSSGQRNTPNG